MFAKELPFRPRLEGSFRIRFYNKVSVISYKTNGEIIENIIDEEIFWVENECKYDIKQRKKYRAIWYLFRDLVRASWKPCFRDGTLLLKMPSLGDDVVLEDDIPKMKLLLRKWMSDSRFERLLKSDEFISAMERESENRLNIRHLIADGKELAERLLAVRQGKISVETAVRPYLQLVSEKERDSFTGFKLSDIWRYFRLTWSTPAETTPGRTLQYLIRDAAHPNHAVMGIASLENCAVQITCRDNELGWNIDGYMEKLSLGDVNFAKDKLDELLIYIEDGIKGINYSGLCDEAQIIAPDEGVILSLFNISKDAEEIRQKLLKFEKDNCDEEKSKLGAISKQVEDALYKRKRSEQLARLLNAKKVLIELKNTDTFEKDWLSLFNKENVISAIRVALVAQKTKHIGSSMLELNVCGAIPPYNEILGGKLVALLASSPQVIVEYKKRYENSVSEIASRMKGADVCRPAKLVYLGTTSLYYVGSSQYNRLKIPGRFIDSSVDLKWKELGKTIGYGTLHISKATTQCLTEATNDGFNKINHVFGEGASPKMRLMSMAIRELLESSSEDLKEFSKHAMARIVYGVQLAKNTTRYLMGLDKEPDYYLDINDYKSSTKKIVDFWRNRWLLSRLNYEPVFERLRGFCVDNLLVGNEIKGASKVVLKPLEEELVMESNLLANDDLKFIRSFYRGSSAYADHIEQTKLEAIHIDTKLDDAIIKAIKAGKDVVLTGNPGDGKSHIIRIISKRLKNIGINIAIENDASTCTDEELYTHWKKANTDGIPYVIAINAAVLYSLYNYCSKKDNFNRVVNAYKQVCDSIIYTGESDTDSCKDVVVFDLSKRNVLNKDMVASVIKNMTDDRNFNGCNSCSFKSDCIVHTNRALMNNMLFIERLSSVLERVAILGYHCTLRELQSFISYLIFGDRTCIEITKTNAKDEYNIVNLIYSGEGRIFEKIREAFDPLNISHPNWDEKILDNNIPLDSWAISNTNTDERLDPNNEAQYALKKRQFFFFNNYGSALQEISNDAITKFTKLFAMEDKAIKKELIAKLNIFFTCRDTGSKELTVWSSHRYNNSSRGILISLGNVKGKQLSVERPILIKSMQEGIDIAQSYIRLVQRDSKSSKIISMLKIDYDMYKFLLETENGVPALFIENKLSKKIWRFVEHIHAKNIDDDYIDIKLYDVQEKKMLQVSIDNEEKPAIYLINND